MADIPTTNYGLVRPESTDSMAAFDTWINPNWTKIEDAVAPPSGTTLPQSGTYNVGDRFYKSDTKSIYILVVKDAIWGWHWRPVQDAISPWLTVPTTALNDGAWGFSVIPANPFQIAYDSRGRCNWRGVVGVTSGTFARNSSIQVFKTMPDGLRPARPGSYMVGVDPLTVGTDGSVTTAYQGAIVYIPADVGNIPFIRAFGGTANTSRVHLTGINYAVGTARFSSP